METFRAFKLLMQIQRIVFKERIEYEMQKNNDSLGNHSTAGTSAFKIFLCLHFNNYQCQPETFSQEVTQHHI